MKPTLRFLAILSLVWALPCNAAPLAAANDATASFADAMFSLPELKSPKDSYLILIAPQGGAEAIQLALPPGSTGVRVGKNVLPAGTWTWRYKVARASPQALIVRTEKELALTTGDLVDGRFPLAWERVEGARRYRISGQTRVKSRADEDPAWDKLSLECFASACARTALASKSIELKPGSEVKWRVGAVDEHDVVIAQSDAGHIQVATTWVQNASNAGFRLQRSDTLSKETASLPATFSYISSQKDSGARSTAYQTEFALIYDGPKPHAGFWPRATLEAHLTSSGAQKSSDAVRIRAGGYRLIQGARPGEGTELTANLKYETEHKGGTAKGLIEIGATPIYGWLGAYWPGPPKRGQANAAGNYARLPWLQVAPVLRFAAEVGKTLDVGTSAETKDTVVRLRTSIRFDAEFNAIASGLGARNVTGFVEGTYWYLPRQDLGKEHHLAKTGLSVGITDELSLEFGYSVGRDSPTFRFARTGTVGLGFKF